MENKSWRSNHGGAIMEKESAMRHPRDTLEATREHPRASQGVTDTAHFGQLSYGRMLQG